MKEDEKEKKVKCKICDEELRSKEAKKVGICLSCYIEKYADDPEEDED